MTMASMTVPIAWCTLTIIIWGEAVNQATAIAAVQPRAHYEHATMKSSARSQNTRIVTRYYDIHGCGSFKLYNTTIGLSEFGEDLVSSSFHTGYHMKRIKKFTVNIHRCLGGVSRNTCEYFNRWSWSTGVCALMSAKHMLWTPMVKAIYPDFKCPIPTTSHEVRNATLDLRSVDTSDMNLDKFIWPLEIKLFNELDQMAVCVKLKVEPRRILLKKPT